MRLPPFICVLFVLSSALAAAPPGLADIIVAADSTGNFTTIQAAVNSVPVNNTTPITIFVRSGTYPEIVKITSGRHKITLQGEDRALTLIQATNNEHLNPGTVNRSLVAVDGCNDFTLLNLTLYNTTPRGGGQAEAFTTKNAQRVTVRNCSFKSYLDTMLLQGSVYLEDCYIEGDIDFNWGTGVAYYNRCELHALTSNGYNFQPRNLATTYGYVLVDSKLTAAASVAAGSFWLARPMGFANGHVAYINCQMAPHIAAAGWMTDGLATLRYWEYQSTDLNGVPLDVSQRAAPSRQISASEAAVMRDPVQVFGGWNPVAAPAQPTQFTAAYSGGQTNLLWAANTEPDLAHYSLYRGTSSDFTPSLSNRLATPTGTSYADVGLPGGYYKLSAVDLGSNESSFALVTPGMTTGVADGGGPLAFSLDGARPNPAAGRDLHVAFTLPSGARARLEVFDVIGRRVLAREVGSLGAGRHTVNLVESRRLPTGIYWVRLVQGTNRVTKRAIVVE